MRRLKRWMRWSSENVHWLLAGVVALAAGGELLRPGPAAADAASDREKQVALSDVALSERLMAVERLRAAGSDAARDALEDVAREGDLRVAAAACAALGRDQAAGSKSRLKDLLGDAGVPENVRIAAASAVAEHWKDDGDIDDLEEKAAGRSAVEAHVTVLKSRVYGR